MISASGDCRQDKYCFGLDYFDLGMSFFKPALAHVILFIKFKVLARF